MWFKRIAIVAIIFSAAWAEAHVDVWPVMLKARGERNDDQALQLHSNSYPSFSISSTFDRWMISVDVSKYERSSDSGNVSIDTEYNDKSLWGGYSLFQGDMWDLYALAGAGVYEQKVKTTAAGVSTTNHSSDRSLVGAGAEYVMRTPYYFSFSTGARLQWTQDLEPEIMPEIYLKLGVSFF